MRSALAEVLAVMTGVAGPQLSAMPWSAHTGEPSSFHSDGASIALLPLGAAARLHVSGVLVPFGVERWLHDSPAEALEALHTRGLWPWSPGEGPQWWRECRDCHYGTVATTSFDGSHGTLEPAPCERCDGEGAIASDTPPSHASLVAVASLGAPTLLRVAELAAEIARHAGCAGATVVWRVMGREDLIRHHRVTARDGNGWGGVYVFSHEHERARRPKSFGGQPAWPKACPWGKASMPAESWPALRSLAFTDDETPRPTGLHLLALDAQRITIGVESVGGDRE